MTRWRLRIRTPAHSGGASLTGADFTGARLRECDLHRVKIADSWLIDVNVSGLVSNFVVNDVDVTAFVAGGLDRRHPERVQLRAVRARASRMALVRGIIDGLTDAGLERICPQQPSPRHPEETRTVGDCLRVIMQEECEHRRYAVRDLAALEADLDGRGAAGE